MKEEVTEKIPVHQKYHVLNPAELPPEGFLVEAGTRAGSSKRVVMDGKVQLHVVAARPDRILQIVKDEGKVRIHDGKACVQVIKGDVRLEEVR
jgi:hypothetical protein